MPEFSYRYRMHPLARERTYRLGETGLVIDQGGREWSVPYADFSFIESFTMRFLGHPTPYARHVLRTPQGHPVVLTAGFRDRWRMTDMREEYQRFIVRLMNAIEKANPDREHVYGRRRLMNRAGGLGGKGVVFLLRMFRYTGPDRWTGFAAWIMRRVGPLLRGHRRALEQIALAFPDKSPQECERIALGMWDNLGRTAVEYSQLETYWRPTNPDPANPTPRMVVDAASQQVLAGIKAAKRRSLHFSLHSANWELCASAAPQNDVKRLVPYRRLRNQPLTAELVRYRKASGTTPLTVGPSMISEIRRKFKEGDALGMLIDQHSVSGIEVTFFGRPTLLNPLFARLVRIYDCPVYGSRVIRRDDGRFGYEIVGPIEPARDARGRVDVQATMQQCASLLERWIREYPEQWLWLHPIWR
jgi:Kdo2-lipid IVA lauroyltransferase/acyltransferase